MMFDEMQQYRERQTFEIPGLVRMDRALLYIKQQFDRLIAEVNHRKTKSLGDSFYSIRRFQSEVFSLCRMSGDILLAETIRNSIQSLSTRSPRKQALEILFDLKEKVDGYQPIQDIDAMQGLRERIASLEAQLPDEMPDKKAQLDTSQSDSVFVIMPFSNEFMDVWRGGIEKAAKTEGFKPIRIDMINKSTNITDDIVESIVKCNLAIIDVTNNNPNVMFELGYAIAKEKPLIIISQSADDLPFDIRNIRSIIYTNTWSGIEELRDQVQSFLRESAPKKKQPEKKVAYKKSTRKGTAQ